MQIDSQRIERRARRRRRVRVLGLAALAAGTVATLALAHIAEAAEPPAFAEVHAAWVAGDRDQLERLARTLEHRVETAPERRARYDLAYAFWRLHLLTRENDRRSAYQAGAIDRAQRLAEDLGDDEAAPPGERVESLVLLSSILGVRADGNLFQKMRLGRQAHRVLARARALDATHPRAQLQLGILLFHTPRAFGGGVDEALPPLERARRALDPEQAAEPTGWPDWGWLDASAWVGQTLAAQGRREEARAVYLETLAREPRMGWIRRELLPALDAGR